MTVPARRQRLVIFARAPRLGTVKSRLGSTAGAGRALEIYAQLASATIAGLHEPTRWDLVVRGSPDDALGELAPWIGNRGIVEPQGGGDLGDRMRRAVDDHLRGGAERVVIVGTDCPDLTVKIVAQAFESLLDAEVVLGPASDGGYYLIGARRQIPELFLDIPWSDEKTLAVSLQRAHQAGYTVRLLDQLADIDTEADWEAWCSRRPTPGVKAP